MRQRGKRKSPQAQGTVDDRRAYLKDEDEGREISAEKRKVIKK
jgi:hypothetical protein